MDDEKHRVILVLRALLVSNKKRSMSLDELSREYFVLEGKRIPTFEYENVDQFLKCSGEFFLNVINNVVIVRERPKLESLHIKELVTQQKSRAKPFRRAISVQNNGTISVSVQNRYPLSSSVQKNFPVSRSIQKPLPAVPAHMAKPSTIFTFDELQTNKNENCSVRVS